MRVRPMKISRPFAIGHRDASMRLPDRRPKDLLNDASNRYRAYGLRPRSVKLHLYRHRLLFYRRTAGTTGSLLICSSEPGAT